jgi:hypothetical protein
MDPEIEALFSKDYSEINCVDKFIGDEKCRKLCTRILDRNAAGFNAIRRITLRGNCIHVNGAQAIADVFKAGVELSAVSIEWNQLGSPGAIFIADSIANNTSLLHLDLKNNGIGDDGASALAAAITHNESLKVLDLRWNQINDRGALAFEPIFKNKQRKPITILLSGNLISSGVMAKIEEWSKVPEEPKKEERPAPAAPRAVDYSALTAEVNKEIQFLRSQCAALTQKSEDLERQLDTSAFRITELEHLLMREQFKNTQLDEALKQAKLRIAEQISEKKGITHEIRAKYILLANNYFTMYNSAH